MCGETLFVGVPGDPRNLLDCTDQFVTAWNIEGAMGGVAFVRKKPESCARRR